MFKDAKRTLVTILGASAAAAGLYQAIACSGVLPAEHCAAATAARVAIDAVGLGDEEPAGEEE